MIQNTDALEFVVVFLILVFLSVEFFKKRFVELLKDRVFYFDILFFSYGFFSLLWVGYIYLQEDLNLRATIFSKYINLFFIAFATIPFAGVFVVLLIDAFRLLFKSKKDKYYDN